MNHRDLTVKYNRENISNILSSQTAIAQPCSVIEIVKISRNIQLSVPIWRILSFKMPPLYIGQIHKDVFAGIRNSNPLFGLNLPISHCDETYMRWFKQKEKNETLFFPGPTTGDATPTSTYDNSICIDTVRCSTPKIIAITDWHSIDNKLTEGVSHIISIRFGKHITINDVINSTK